MKLLKSILLSSVLVGLVSTDMAWADHHGGHGGSHFSSRKAYGGRWHGPGYFGRGAVFIGGGWPWFYPWYYGVALPVLPDSFYPVEAAPVGYAEMNPASTGGAPAMDAAPPNYWYYCHNPEGYYPYVKSCPGGWQKVPAEPPKQP